MASRIGRLGMTMDARTTRLRQCLVQTSIGLAAVTAVSSASAQTPPPPPPPEPVEAAPDPSRFGLTLGVEGGYAYFTENTPFGTDIAIGRALSLGYELGVRGSFELLPWLAVDLRGRVLHNDGNDLVHGGSLETVGGLAAARFTLPLPHIRPYALVGAGVYGMTASGAGTQLVSGTVPALELGLGATVPTGRNVEVGVEWTYNHLSGETLSTNPTADGGDPSTLSLFVQYRFRL
jgi:opacity protein-like surface antigen